MDPSPDKSLALRSLRPEDHPAVLRLWEEAGLDVRPRGRDGPKAFAAQLRAPNSHYLGAFRGEELVGAVLANHTGRKGWINRLAVAPQERRRGVARRLVRTAEEALRADGIEVVAALAQRDNAASLALFESLGYVVHPEVVYLSRRERPEA